jgi:DNA replication and repair protein RecF
MQVKSIHLQDFRNYKNASIDFQAGKNIVIGDNAQGKTNLLEAVDLMAGGRSSRASEDRELVCWGARRCRLELVYAARNYDQAKLSLDWSLKEPASPGSTGRCQKLIKVNGVLQESARGLLGRLVTVSFSADDMKILRGGPKFRRDWLDGIAVRLKPSFHDSTTSYARSVSQRNKLLKTLAEKGKLTVSDQDELQVWDRQLARFGTLIIKMRLAVLALLLPEAERHQSTLSGASETLTIDYDFRAQEQAGDLNSVDEEAAGEVRAIKSMSELQSMENNELANFLLKLMKELRWLELRRRQSLVGPHRDNLIFKLNGASAVSFASQGQQRSLVLSLKLAELARVEEHIGETPVLLLDDVLSELDEKRAELLLSAVSAEMQTIMSTTHLTAINQNWLADARVLSVHAGALASGA